MDKKGGRGGRSLSSTPSSKVEGLPKQMGVMGFFWIPCFLPTEFLASI